MDDQASGPGVREAEMRSATDLVVSRLTASGAGLTPAAHELLERLLDAAVLRAVDEDAEPAQLAEPLRVLEAAMAGEGATPTRSALRGPGPDEEPPDAGAMDEQDVRDVLSRICPLWPFC